MKIEKGIPLQAPSAGPRTDERDANLRQAAKMYESHFLNEMVKAMRSTTGQEEGVVKQNFAEKIFTEQLDQQYVEGWADKGGVGLADMIYNQIHDQYYGTNQKHIQALPHALPIAPTGALPLHIKTIPQTSLKKLGYRFELTKPSAGDVVVQAPLPGRISEVKGLSDNWNSVTLDHGQGLRSELTFPGLAVPFDVGAPVQTGQKLGLLDPKRPVVAWNLDWRPFVSV